MSDVLISAQQKQITDLLAQVAQLNAEGKTRRIENKRLKGELETATGQVATLTTERDGFKAKAESGPTEHTAKIAELEGQLLSRDHTDAFAGVREFGVKSKAADGTETETKYTL